MKNGWSVEDIKTINSRMIDEYIGVIPPRNDDIDVFYVCSTNKEHIVIATIFFEAC